MNDKDISHSEISYSVCGYSALESLASGIITIATGTIRWLIRLVKGVYRLLVSIKDKLAMPRPTSPQLPPRRHPKPLTRKDDWGSVGLAKFRSGTFF